MKACCTAGLSSDALCPDIAMIGIEIGDLRRARQETSGKSEIVQPLAREDPCELMVLMVVPAGSRQRMSDSICGKQIPPSASEDAAAIRGRLTQIDNAARRRMAAVVVDAADPEQAVLFSSRACGDARADSDFALLAAEAEPFGRGPSGPDEESRP